jgi:uncharacterized protein YdeI (YjbR/CyaY-like superfamily)
MKARYFRTPTDFRKWLEEHHATSRELLVGFHKVGSGKPSLTWPESVDEALCFGWIDGIRKRVDDHSYTIRFTPRKPTSTWSSINIKRAHALVSQGLMQPSGVKAFQARKANKSGTYSYEQRSARLDQHYETRLKENPVAWEFFYSQPPGYRKTLIWYVVSAKREQTRIKRLERLIEASAQGMRI